MRLCFRRWWDYLFLLYTKASSFLLVLDGIEWLDFFLLYWFLLFYWICIYLGSHFREVFRFEFVEQVLFTFYISLFYRWWHRFSHRVHTLSLQLFYIEPRLITILYLLIICSSNLPCFILFLFLINVLIINSYCGPWILMYRRLRIRPHRWTLTHYSRIIIGVIRHLAAMIPGFPFHSRVIYRFFMILFHVLLFLDEAYLRPIGVINVLFYWSEFTDIFIL